MKTLISLALISCISALAQNAVDTTSRNTFHGSQPASCAVGDTWDDTSASAGSNWKICTTAGTPGTWTVQGGSGGSPAFSSVTSGTNTSASMVVGSGGSLAPTSATAGTISANQINGTALSGLSTGILKNTTTTGVPSIATASDISALNYVAGGGTAQAQTVTLSPAITALAAGLKVRWLPVANNTAAAPTLLVNGVGSAAAITKLGSHPLVANDLTSIAIAEAVWDGTQWELLNPQTVAKYQNSSDATPAGMYVFKSRGTAASPTVVSNLDTTMDYGGYAYDGTNWLKTASFGCYADGTISAGSIPTQCEFDVMNTGGALTIPLTLASTGYVTFWGGTTIPGPATITQIIGSGSAPTVANGAGAGTSPGTPTITGTDMDGILTVITGTATTTNATVATITFSAAKGTAPVGCSLQPRNNAASAVNTFQFTTAPSTTSWTVSSAATALTVSKTIIWSYHCE